MRLIRSHGMQLESAYLYNMDAELICCLVWACWNYRFHLRPESGDPLLPALSQLGDKLKSIIIVRGREDWGSGHSRTHRMDV